MVSGEGGMRPSRADDFGAGWFAITLGVEAGEDDRAKPENSTLVMVAAGNDNDIVRFDRVNQAMLAVDAPRPRPGQITPERFGFADPLERRSQNLPNQEVDAPDQFAVMLLKPLIVAPA